MQAEVHPVQPSWTSYAVTLGILVIVMALRFRRMGKIRPLKLESLWIVPAIYFVIAALMFLELPPVGPVAIACVLGLPIGGAIGWVRGTMMHIHVDPKTHALNQKASPAALFFLIALVAVRMGARNLLGQHSGLSPAMLTDPLIAFALGMFTLTRLEMYLRAKRLLEEARARA